MMDILIVFIVLFSTMVLYIKLILKNLKKSNLDNNGITTEPEILLNFLIEESERRGNE